MSASAANSDPSGSMVNTNKPSQALHVAPAYSSYNLPPAPESLLSTLPVRNNRSLFL